MDLEKAYSLIVQKLSIWLREFVRLLPNIVLAALIIVGGLFIARLVKKFSTKVIRRITHHESVNNLFASFIYLIVVGIFFFIALSVLQLDKAVTSILAGAGIAGIALAFAFQDIAANFMSGIFLTVMRPIRLGDLVKTNDYMGKVIMINLRDTVIKTFQGQQVIIPNKEIFTKSIENYTKTGKRRIDLKVGISYGDDLEKVKQVTLEAAKKISVLDPNESIRFFYTEFADSSINFVLQFWLNATDQPIFWQGQSEAIMLIKKAYDENNITIPYPIRTLDFGIKGGQTLSEMKLNLSDENNQSQ